MKTGELVVGVTGAIAILAVALGIAVVHERGGPHQEPLAATGIPVVATGSHMATSGSGTELPGGTCAPEPPATACTPPRTETVWHLEGLPRPPDGLSYAAYFTGGTAPVPLGALAPDGAALRLEHAEDVGRQDATGLLLVLTAAPDAARPEGLRLHTQTIGPTADGEPMDLGAAFDAGVVHGPGIVRLDPIGAVEVSLLVEVETDAPPAAWTLHAWHLGSGVSRYLGALASDGDVAALDERYERLRLDPGDRVVVRLLPEGATPGDDLEGYPAYEALL